jgi:hypothetical protein
MASKIIQPIEAVVQHITQAKQGHYGPFQSVLFIDDQGREIWKSFALDAPELDILKPGLKVRLIPNGSSRSGKDSHVIELATQPETEKPREFKGQLSDHQKREIAAYIEQMAALYRFAYGQAAQNLQGVANDPDTLKSCAATLFIAAQQKFNL